MKSSKAALASPSRAGASIATPTASSPMSAIADCQIHKSSYFCWSQLWPSATSKTVLRTGRDKNLTLNGALAPRIP